MVGVTGLLGLAPSAFGPLQAASCRFRGRANQRPQLQRLVSEASRLRRICLVKSERMLVLRPRPSAHACGTSYPASRVERTPAATLSPALA